jgi:membrane-bound lytic murein transglycosylase MltF
VEAQVEAAVRTYYGELTRAAQTLRTEELKKLTSQGCPCAGSAKSIDRTRAKNRQIPQAKWRVQRVAVHDVIAKSAGAQVWYTVTAYEVLDSNGRVLDRLPKRVKHVDLSLLNTSQGWILANVFDLGA